MRTDELIGMLAAGDIRPRQGISGRYAIAVAGGLGVAVAATLVVLGLNPALGTDAETTMFWVKLGFPMLLAGATLAATRRLARPGTAVAGLAPMLLAPVVAVWLLAAGVLSFATPAERPDLLFGETWRVCPPTIAALSLPALALLLWAVRGFAPTRPRLAGAAAGALAGALGAMAYALHCPELGAPFIATWYVFGMLMPCLLGAALGPRALAW